MTFDTKVKVKILKISLKWLGMPAFLDLSGSYFGD